MEPPPARRGAADAIGTSTPISATSRRWRRCSANTARASRWSSTPRRSLRTTGPRAIRMPTSRSMRAAPSICSKRCRQHCARGAVRLHLDQQGLRRHAEPAAAGGDRDALGTFGRPPIRRHGIDETMSIDQSMHSLFGVSKVAADVLVQEYGRYFGMKTVCFRGGCLTGPSHSGTAAARLPRLSDEMHCDRHAATRCSAMPANRCATTSTARIWSAPSGTSSRTPARPRSTTWAAVATATARCWKRSRSARSITGRRLDWSYSEDNRAGDHIWWISDTRRFRQHYPGWSITRGVPEILEEIYLANRQRWRQEGLTHA